MTVPEGEDRTRQGFRPDIEGLRAVAVLAVVLFHAGVPGVAGGFVGVDVFFVVSGFLITGMLWREVSGTGRVRLARFYGARARRLLPAAVVVLVATSVAGALLLPPLQVPGVLRDAVAAALYVGNYRLAVQGTDYLAADDLPSPFQHYWSLGVEEQFYLLWPALLILAGWLVRRAGRRERLPVAAAVLALSLVAAGSFAVSLGWTRSEPPWAYFSLPSRAWELAVGGLVALTAGAWRQLPRPPAVAAGWAGLALLVGSCGLLGSATPFPGTAALAPVLGTALVVGAGCAGPRRGAGAVLAVPPLRWVGRLSYSWYLWHWPLLVLAPAVVGSSLDLPARVVTAAVAAALAVGTLVVVENPVRLAAPLRRSPGRSLLVGGGLTAAGVCVALVALVLTPSTVGSGAVATAPRLGDGAPAPTAPGRPTPDPREQQIAALTGQVQSAVAASADVLAVPANLDPPLTEVAADRAAPFIDGCVLSWTAVRQPPCVYGDPAGSPTVALVGDSHAAAWYPAVRPVAEQRHWRLDVLAKVTCPLLDLPIRSPYLGRSYTECEQWRTGVFDRLRAERPALVVLAAAHRYGADFGFTAFGPAWIDALGRTVAALRALGSAVLVLGPVPDPRTWAPRCLSEHLATAVACSPDRAVAVDEADTAAERRVTEGAGGRYADLTALFCTATRCPLVVGNTLVYRDDNHVSVEYAALLAPAFALLCADGLPGG